MAVSLIETYGLLNRWQVVMGESIWGFNQASTVTAQQPEFRGVYLQSERDDIAASLRSALDVAANTPGIGFYIRPVYITETLPFSNHSAWDRQQLRLTYGYVQAIGQRTTTVIEADAAVAYSDTDPDTDGIDDTATITVAHGGVAASEIKVFFREAEGAPAPADSRYEIDGLTVTINGANAVITGHRALFVRPDTVWGKEEVAQERFAADVTNAAHFVTAVDVYQVATDASNAVTLLLPPDAGSSTPGTAVGAAYIRDDKLGLVSLSAASTPAKQPHAVTISYLAGFPLQADGNPSATLEQALIRMTNARLVHRPVIVAEAVMDRWATDSAPVPDSLLTTETATNPLGLTMGEFEAWRTFRRFATSAPERTEESA